MGQQVAVRALSVVGVVVLGMLVAGCSEDAAETPTTSAPPEATTTITTEPTTTRPPTTSTSSSSTTTTTEAPASTTTLIDADADPFPPELLIGTWELNSGYILEFRDDGQWQIADRDTLDDPFDHGSYEVEAATLVIATAPTVDDGCEPGDTGYYQLSAPDDGEIDLEPVDDPCTARLGDFRWGLTPHRP